MRRLSGLLAVAASVGFSLLAAAGTQRAPAGLPSAAPPSGAAVFTSDLGIYVANLDGTGLKRLTRDGDDTAPVWSPDAKRIAFSRFSGGLDDAVMVVNADGRGLRRVGSGESPGWSPDGSRIVVAGQRGVVEGGTGRVLRPGLAGFWILRPDGTAPRRVETGEIAGNLSWAPDGRRIAFIQGGSVRAYDLASKQVTRLAPVSAGTSFVAWSPNGKEIALGAGDVDDDDGELTVVDVATRRVRKLADKAREPVWSPDSTRIAFWEAKRLLTIGRDGRGPRRVASAANASGRVSWSGDGRSLLFSRPRSAGVGSDVWWGRADGPEAGRITKAFPTGAAFSAPQWAATSVRSRPASSVPAISLEPTRLLATPSKVVELAADESRAAVETETTSGCPLSIWDAAGKLHGVAGGYCRTEMAFAGRRLAWVVYNGELFDRYLEIATDGTKPTSVDYAPEKYDYDMLGHLAGDTDLLVYDKWRDAHSGDILDPDPGWYPVDMSLWRIDGMKPKKIVSGADAFPIVDVDAGRIAVLREDGKLVLLDRQGKRLSAFQLGRTGMRPESSWPSADRWPVRLTRSFVVALRGTKVEVRDATSGTVRHRWPTAPSEARLTLEDARGNFAVYKAGIALHLLRLSDGHDRRLEIADAEGPLHAELERNGLYYSYNTPAGAKRGRVAFVPLAQLNARFGG